MTFAAKEIQLQSPAAQPDRLFCTRVTYSFYAAEPSQWQRFAGHAWLRAIKSAAYQRAEQGADTHLRRQLFPNQSERQPQQLPYYGRHNPFVLHAPPGPEHLAAGDVVAVSVVLFADHEALAAAFTDWVRLAVSNQMVHANGKPVALEYLGTVQHSNVIDLQAPSNQSSTDAAYSVALLTPCTLVPSDQRSGIAASQLTAQDIFRFAAGRYSAAVNAFGAGSAINFAELMDSFEQINACVVAVCQHGKPRQFSRTNNPGVTAVIDIYDNLSLAQQHVLNSCQYLNIGRRTAYGHGQIQCFDRPRNAQ